MKKIILGVVLAASSVCKAGDPSNHISKLLLNSTLLTVCGNLCLEGPTPLLVLGEESKKQKNTQPSKNNREVQKYVKEKIRKGKFSSFIPTSKNGGTSHLHKKTSR